MVLGSENVALGREHQSDRHSLSRNRRIVFRTGIFQTSLGRSGEDEGAEEKIASLTDGAGTSGFSDRVH